MHEVRERSQRRQECILHRVARVAELVDAADSDISNLSPRGEIPEVQPVKLGEGPEALVTRADAEPSPRKREGRCREQTAGTYSLNGHGDGVLQTTNPRRVRPGRRKPKWQENPPPLKACRFDSDLGHQRHKNVSPHRRFA